MSEHELVLVANARMPSQRAQSLQVAQVAASFARAGRATTLLHARRRDTPPVGDPATLWDYYSVPEGARPAVRALRCIDWIDRLPRRFQYVPARLQELSFARHAARVAAGEHRGALVISRELETARALVRGGHARTYCEVHRVPGGNTRRRWLRETAEGAAGWIAISGGVAADLVELGVKKSEIHLAHDGFEPARFAGLPTRAAAREQLSLDAGRPLVVYTGGLLEWKGVDLLIEAARSLPEAAFVIAGGMDADVARLRERARGLENVRIEGFQPPARVPLYLAAADLGVVPNRSQPAISARYTSPLKVFEAMAAGLPLVASDLPSLREILTNGEDACLVPPDDAGTLADGIRALLDDDSLRSRYATRMRARAADHDWDARAHGLLEWINDRIGAGSTR